VIMARVVRKPPEPLSRWIEDVIRLPVGLSAEPGPIKLASYMIEIADVIADPQVERVTLMKATRVGWTTLMTAAVGHFLIRDPSRT
jgi:phage terminase large subunit GpA-like protein